MGDRRWPSASSPVQRWAARAAAWACALGVAGVPAITAAQPVPQQPAPAPPPAPPEQTPQQPAPPKPAPQQPAPRPTARPRPTAQPPAPPPPAPQQPATPQQPAAPPDDPDSPAPPAPEEPAPQQPVSQAPSPPQAPSQAPLPPVVPAQAPAPEPEEKPSVQISSVLPILRVAPGVGVHFDGDGKASSSFDIDVTTGAAISFREGLMRVADLGIEASYTFSSEPARGGHLAGIGATPMLALHELLSIGWAPKFVIGGTWQGFAAGMRNMVVVPVLGNTFQLEAGHQWLHVEDGDQHELRVLVGVDLVRVMVLMVLAQM